MPHDAKTCPVCNSTNPVTRVYSTFDRTTLLSLRTALMRDVEENDADMDFCRSRLTVIDAILANHADD